MMSSQLNISPELNHSVRTDKMGDNVIYSRLFMKNVPMYMTKGQILSTFFPDLENIELIVPKPSNANKNSDTKFIFAQLNSNNEGKMALKFINRLDFQNVRACFAESSLCGRKRKYNENSADDKVQEEQCAFCSTAHSEFLCDGCSSPHFATYYCSMDHQIKDWRRHKSECKPMPQLRRVDGSSSSLTDDTTAVSDNDVEPVGTDLVKRGRYFIQVNDSYMKPGSKVLISSVINNRIVYIRPISPEYDRLMDTIKKYSMNSVLLLDKPSINEYVLVPFNGSFYRANVQDFFEADSGGNNVKVSLTDLGNELRLKWQDLKKLNYKLRGLPTLTIKVMLSGIYGKNDKAMENYLCKLWSNKEKLEIVEIHGSRISERQVVLRDTSTNIIVNEQIKVVSSNMEKERNFYNISEVPRFATFTSIKLFVIDYSQLEQKKLLSCMPYEIFSDYFNMLEELKEHTRKMSNDPYTPIENEICLVKYNEKWYRASYCNNVDLQTEFMKFLLIDHMIEAFVSKANIRRIPHAFSQRLFTSLCYVEGVDRQNLEAFKMKIQTDKCIFPIARYENETGQPILSNLIK